MFKRNSGYRKQTGEDKEKDYDNGEAWWPSWYSAEFVIWRSQVRVPVAPLCRHVISLGKEFTHIVAQVNSAFYPIWTENEYQLRLRGQSP